MDPQISIFHVSYLSSGTPIIKGIVHQFFSVVKIAASRGPMRRESRSLVAPRVEVLGDKMKTQKC